MKEAGRKILRIIPNVVLILFSLSCIFPAIWLFYSSLKDKAEFYQSPIALPKSPNFQHYISIFTNSKILTWMGNTIRNSFLSLVFILLIGFVVGYFLSRYKFRGRKALYGYFLVGMLVPVHALMVPMYVLFTKMGLTDNWFTLVLPYTALSLPIAIFLVESYVKSIPLEVEERRPLTGVPFTEPVSIILPCASYLSDCGHHTVFSMYGMNLHFP